MGRTSRWFRSLLGSKKPSGKPGRTGNNASFSSEALTAYPHGLDANKHAIVVAAATANAAEAALVAARAAAEVVRLTATSATAGRSRAAAAAADDDDDNYAGLEPRRHLAAVILQSAFRAYLARRALKALKGLVKLQALVRGHIVRKQSTYMLQRMQAMARIQARACAHRAYTSDSPHSSNKSFHSQNPGSLQDLASLKTIDHHSRAHGTRPNGSVLKRSVSKSNTKDNIGRGKTCNGSNWLDKWMEENAGNKLREASLTNEYCDDEKSDKILEVDTWKPHMDLNQNDQAFQRFQHVSAWNHNEPIYIRIDALSAHSTKTQRPTRSQSPLHFSKINSGKVNQTAVGVAENSSASSRPGSSSSRRGPSIPARSECLPSFYSNYMGLPNYMTYTESSQAKVRSQSAPRQRLNSERPGALKRYVHGYWDEETISVKGWPLHANFSTIAYPGTDSFEKFGYA